MSDRFSKILSFIYFWGKKHQYQFSIFQSTECIPFLEERHCVTTVCIFKVLFQHSNWRIGISICQKWKVGIDFCYIGFQDSWGLRLLFNYICLHNMIQHVWYLIPVNDCNTQNCKPTFICVREIVARFVRASLLHQIFISVIQSSNVSGISFSI